MANLVTHLERRESNFQIAKTRMESACPILNPDVIDKGVME